MEVGTIARWNVEEGGFIEAGSIICEVETDKATVDYEATDDAYLAKIIQPAGGGELPVGALIGITVEEEDDVTAFKDYTPDVAPAVSSVAPKETSTPSPPSSVVSPPPPPLPTPPVVPKVAVSPQVVSPSPLFSLLREKQRRYTEEFGDTGHSGYL
eukprot:g5479.t1